MAAWSNELRLALTVLLNAAVLAGAYRFVRSRGVAPLQAACDAFLLYFVVQYVAVALPGAFHVFNLWTMSAVGFIAAAALTFTPSPRVRGEGRGEGSSLDARESNRESKSPSPQPSPRTRGEGGKLALLTCFAFVIAYTASHVYDERLNPPIATDALVYHLPTAVYWIQSGTIGLYPTWYWNPAATYSPATGMTFMAWWMNLSGNDVFVRFLQIQPLLMIFLLVARLAREFGAGHVASGLLGVAAAMSRPFISESLFPKDDLFVTVFFGAAVLSLTQGNLRDRLGPWRVGIAMGMVLACKYTVLLACPLFVFMVDAPSRAKWRWSHWLIAIAVACLLFVPWYARTAMLTGNPLYPVDVKLFGNTLFPGMFATVRDEELRTAGGVWKMLGNTYHSLPGVLIVLLGAAWAAATVFAGRSVLRDPLRRACLIGTAVTFVVFIVTSPHHEVRYMYPLILLLFTVPALPLARLGRGAKPQAAVGIVIAALLAIASVATAFDRGLANRIATLLIPAIIAALLVLGAGFVQVRFLRLPRSVLTTIALATVTLIAVPAYVFWNSYLSEYYQKRSEELGESGISYAWSLKYEAEEPLWSFVRDDVPDDATLAIANTYFVYAFQDSQLRRRLTYAPVRRGVSDFLHFPRLGDTVPGDLIVQRMTDAMNADADVETWLANLKATGAQFVVVARMREQPDPPERAFAEANPARFEKLFDAPSGTVYRIVR